MDGIKTDLREIGWGRVEWIHLIQDRDCWRAVVNAVMNLQVLAPESLLVNVQNIIHVSYCHAGDTSDGSRSTYTTSQTALSWQKERLMRRQEKHETELIKARSI
jgi:hypothetical protein